MTDVVAGQRALAELLLDNGSRQAWVADPAGYASARLPAGTAAMLAGLDPVRVTATAAVVAGKGAAAVPLEPTPTSAAVISGSPAPGRQPPVPTGASRARERPGPVLVGCGYRPQLLRHLWRRLDLVDVWEHTIDVYLGGGAAGVRELARLASSRPVVLHSLDLSVGSPAARARPERLGAVRDIVGAAGVDELSDHLGFSRVDDRRLHDFAPLWRVEEQLDLVVANVAWLQEVLGVRLALENPSVLFDPGGELGWAEFANEVVSRTGCGLLLDITNLLLDEANGLRHAAVELSQLDLDAVTGVHLGGGEESGGIFWDAHHAPLPDADLAWLDRLLPKMPNCRTIVVERDGRFAEGDEVVADLEAIHSVVSGHSRSSVG